MKQIKKKCKHKWEEDPMFADGIMMMISGSAQDLGQVTRLNCKKCGEAKYVRVKDLGSIMDIYKRNTPIKPVKRKLVTKKKKVVK